MKKSGLARTLTWCLPSALCALGVAAGSTQAQAQEQEQGPAAPLQEIMVTATRHEESLSKVPISVTALTPGTDGQNGIKDFQDIVRFTPGVTSTTRAPTRSRSAASPPRPAPAPPASTSTTRRSRCARVGFNPDDTLPKTFDLDRVEVLRGPQGTLFGAGSEGGTVRYILTQPSLTSSSTYVRSELSYTDGGQPSYEVGVAHGGAAHRRHARLPRQRLVPLRRRLDRPRRSDHRRGDRANANHQRAPCSCASR